MLKEGTSIALDFDQDGGLEIIVIGDVKNSCVMLTPAIAEVRKRLNRRAGQSQTQGNGHGFDPIYCGDEYPREGCEIRIEVDDKGYRLRIYEPGGKYIEGYARVATPDLIAQMVKQWCSGKRPTNYPIAGDQV